jgi:hypothetical protein
MPPHEGDEASKYAARIQRLEARQDKSLERQTDISVGLDNELQEAFHPVARPAMAAGELAVRKVVSGVREKRIERLKRLDEEKDEADKPKRFRGDRGSAQLPGRLARLIPERKEKKEAPAKSEGELSIGQKQRNRRRGRKAASLDPRPYSSDKHNWPEGDSRREARIRRRDERKYRSLVEVTDQPASRGDEYKDWLEHMREQGKRERFTINVAANAALAFRNFDSKALSVNLDNLAGPRLLKQNSKLVDEEKPNGPHVLKDGDTFGERHVQDGLRLEQQRHIAHLLGLETSGELTIQRNGGYTVKEAIGIPDNPPAIPGYSQERGEYISADGTAVSPEDLARIMSANYIYNHREQFSQPGTFSRAALSIFKEALEGRIQIGSGSREDLMVSGFKLQVARALGFEITGSHVDEESKRTFAVVNETNILDHYAKGANSHIADVLKHSVRGGKKTPEEEAEEKLELDRLAKRAVQVDLEREALNRAKKAIADREEGLYFNEKTGKVSREKPRDKGDDDDGGDRPSKPRGPRDGGDSGGAAADDEGYRGKHFKKSSGESGKAPEAVKPNEEKAVEAYRELQRQVMDGSKSADLDYNDALREALRQGGYDFAINDRVKVPRRSGEIADGTIFQVALDNDGKLIAEVKYKDAAGERWSKWLPLSVLHDAQGDKPKAPESRPDQGEYLDNARMSALERAITDALTPRAHAIKDSRGMAYGDKLDPKDPEWVDAKDHVRDEQIGRYLGDNDSPELRDRIKDELHRRYTERVRKAREARRK